MSGEVKMGGGFNDAARSQMSPGLLRQIAAQEEQEARQAAEERRKREARAEAWRSGAVQSAVAEALDAGEQFSPQMLEGHGLGHTRSEFVALVSARQDHEDAMAAARERQEFRRWQEERSASMSDRVGSPARRVGPGAGPGATVNAEREQVAAAAAAVALGEDTAAAYWQAAAQRPGVGALVALQSAPGWSVRRTTCRRVRPPSGRRYARSPSSRMPRRWSVGSDRPATTGPHRVRRVVRWKACRCRAFAATRSCT